MIQIVPIGSNAPFRLLDLPPEIRMLIYQFAVIQRNRHKGQQIAVYMCQPYITRVSRAIRDQTLPLFYSNNPFMLEIGAEPAAINSTKKRLRFNLGLQNMVRAGYFDLMPEITIFYMADENKETAHGKRYGLQVKFYNTCPNFYSWVSYDDCQRLAGKSQVWHWPKDRLDDKCSDWSSLTAVEAAVKVQQSKWSQFCNMSVLGGMSETLENMPVGRLSEILHILLRGRHWPDQTALAASGPAEPTKFSFL